MRGLIVALVAAGALSFSAGVKAEGVAESVAPHQVSQTEAVGPVAQAAAGSLATVHPMWIRTCGWANCSVYFNRSETRIAAYGGALLSSLICTMLRSTPAALFCTAISWAVGKAGDSAVSGGRCVKLSFSRWTGVVYYIGTYSGWQCK